MLKGSKEKRILQFFSTNFIINFSEEIFLETPIITLIETINKIITTTIIICSFIFMHNIFS